jgi:hypothetical protein
LDEINPVIVPDLADFGEGRRADAVVKSHVRSSLELFNTLMSRGVCREQARMVLPQNLYTEYYGTVNLNNLASAVTPALNGRFNESQTPVWKLRQRFGRRLWEHINKMSYHKLKPKFEIGDLALYVEYGGSTIFSADTIEKMAVIISGPNYGMSMTYEDWEVIDEPLFDILCDGRLQKNIPQKYLQKVRKK